MLILSAVGTGTRAVLKTGHAMLCCRKNTKGNVRVLYRMYRVCTDPLDRVFFGTCIQERFGIRRGG